MAGEKVRLTHTGPQIDAGIDAALNPDTVPEADSDALITSDAVAKVQQGFAPIENAATAANAYAIGDLLVWGGVLYKAKAAIAIGDSFTVGTNIETTTVADKLNNIDTEITTDTDTIISGLLKGSSGKVAAAVGDTDFATPAAMTATRQMLAPILADPAGQAVSAGDYFIYNGTLYKALQAITSAMTAATFTGATYSEAVSGGGLNALKSAISGATALMSHAYIIPIVGYARNYTPPSQPAIFVGGLSSTPTFRVYWTYNGVAYLDGPSGMNGSGLTVNTDGSVTIPAWRPITVFYA